MRLTSSRISALIVCAVALGVVVAATHAQSSGRASQARGRSAAAPAEHVIIAARDMKWGPAPEGLPPGAQVAVLHGDPNKVGGFTIAMKVPDGYTVPPHWHPTDENVVVTEGTLMLGMGDKTDQGSMTSLGTGSYALMPRRAHHYARAKGATTATIFGMGPFQITYVNPQDDPRKKKTTTK